MHVGGLPLRGSRSSLTLLATAERAHHLLELTVQWAMHECPGDVDTSGLLAVRWEPAGASSGQRALSGQWLRLLTGIDSLFCRRTAME